MRKISKLVTALLVLAVFSCQKVDDTTKDTTPKTTETPINLGAEITRDFLGTIIDKDKNPIAGVNISIKNKTATTDGNGVFIIKDANVNQRFAYVQAKKAGFIDASRSVVPTEGTNNITIMMLDDTPTATVKSGEASEVKTDDGASVKLDGNYIKADGTSYTGDVNVTVHFLNPNDDNMNDQMPGMLYAEDTNGDERMLQTFGMLAVELKGTGGEDLNLAKDTKAKISIPVTGAIAANAPATIPLWYFDVDKGYWIEEGKATLQGSNYVGEVSHFSFWNFDIKVPAAQFCITITDNDGNAITNTTVALTSSNFGTTYGTTNSYGEVCGLTPKDEILELNIFNEACNDTPVYTENIGPFSNDTTKSIRISKITSETVTGKFSNCDNQNVTNGYVFLKYGNQSFKSPVNNGNFSINLLKCQGNDSFSLRGFDYDNQQTTGKINYTFTTPNTYIGDLKSCDTFSEFIQYTIDGNRYSITKNIDVEICLEDFLMTNLLDIRFGQNDSKIMGNLTNELIGSYTHTCFENSEDIYGFLFYTTEIPTYDCNTSSNVTFKLTYFEAEKGGYVDLNFEGTYIDIQGEEHSLSGTCHVIIDKISCPE